MERIKNENTKEIMVVKGKPDIIDFIEQKRLHLYGQSKGCQRREYHNQLWIGYHETEGKGDVQEKRRWKEYKEP